MRPFPFVPVVRFGLASSFPLFIRAIAFAAMGTAGQRCTTLRRLIVHDDMLEPLMAGLERAYASVPVGDPRDAGALGAKLTGKGGGGSVLALVADEAAADAVLAASVGWADGAGAGSGS